MSTASPIIKKMLKALLLSLILSIILTGVFSVFVFFMNISERTIETTVMLLSSLSVCLAALVLAKNIDKNGLLSGLILSILYFLVLVIMSLLINGSLSACFSNILRLFTILAGGALGGVVGINTK